MLERRSEHGEVVVVEVVNVFTASEPDSAGNVRCADYRANGGVGEMYRMRELNGNRGRVGTRDYLLGRMPERRAGACSGAATGIGR